uniref:NADH-ubiquinone oxidoreductase chain 5 n=1 Tax=Paduniella communis TaxID=2904892 RepID=A0A9E8RTY3_9NEOP|nr:NADH dehydrogenase subunit 5 [Paduniella communis]UZZ44254.1 NADH dehydrogenase subunit 5 [Paduniella communis]
MLCKYFISYMYLFFFFFFFMCMGLNFLMLNYYFVLEWELISLNSSNIVFLILLDWVSLMFISLVMLISSMVVYYSKFYMMVEIFQLRFILLVLLFIFSMFLMILSPNLISILLGWDGLGFVSYALIIYYQNVKSYNSGMLTVLMNRVGDALILLSISWMINYGSWSMFMLDEFMFFDLEMKMISLLLFLGAITKSAQIPFSIWLPAAMAAPTPVSALVHSSTLVTAGVYLLIRFMNVLENTFILKLLFVLSLLTMFMAGVCANYEFDLKKIIALSTLSQLGLMLSVLSMNLKLLCFFHLMTHAMFKSMLFMCAGIMIHMMNNNQDIRLMGNLIQLSPILCLMFNIGNLSLCGLPFLAGFYSKDMMLEMYMFMKFNLIFFFFFFFSIGLTVSYTLRLIYYSLFSYINYYVLFSFYNNYKMILSMFILMLFTLYIGCTLNWLIFYNLNFIYLSNLLKSMIMLFMILGLFMGYFIYKMKISGFMSNYLKFCLYINSMLFMINLLTYGLNYFLFFFSKMLDKNLNLGWFEKIGSQGLYLKLSNYSLINHFIQLNNLKFYLLMFFFLMMMFMF